MKDVIKKLRALFDVNKIDGYIIPKNDEFFSEFANNDRLKKITILKMRRIETLKNAPIKSIFVIYNN